MVVEKKCCAIIQARLGSTRLPGKVLKPIKDKPMLWHIVNRLKHANQIDKIIIATTILPEDSVIETFCIENDIEYYRGSPDDVLSRYYYTADSYHADIIIRITSDCPVIDPQIIDRMIEQFKNESKNQPLDYLSNTVNRTFPQGLDAEVFSFAVLAIAHQEAKQDYEREHVTPYIYNHPKKFTVKNFVNAKDYSFHRWTVDTGEDFKLIEEIYKNLYKPGELFLFNDIIKLFEEKPRLINLNKNVKQKKLGE